MQITLVLVLMEAYMIGNSMVSTQGQQLLFEGVIYRIHGCNVTCGVLIAGW